MTELQRMEWVDALGAAMIRCLQAEKEGDRFPQEHLVYHALETWDGVIANLMAICVKLDEVKQMRAAIETVLADAESQHPGGWGPDVTMVSVLRKALEGG